MSLSVEFYDFGKPKNDVVQPTGLTPTLQADVLLKEPCDVLYPKLLLNTSSNPVSSNYCYISAFGRYYFIKTWVSDHNLWEAECVVDVLASWKTEILGTTQYVIRSSSHTNEYIPDMMVPMTKETISKTSVINSGVTDPQYLGCGVTYVLQISNDTTEKINGVQYLACGQAAIQEIINKMLNNNNTWGWGSTEAAFGLTDAVARSIVNPLQYIGKCYMLPFAPSEIPDTFKDAYSNPIKVGFWPLSAPTEPVYTLKNPSPGAPIYGKIGTITLKRHPNALTHGAWLNGYPFTKHYIYAGPFGRIPIDSDLIIDQYNNNGDCDLEMSINVDYLGMACLKITKIVTGRGEVILSKTYADVSTLIPLTQTKSDLISYIGQMGSVAASAASGNVGSTMSAFASVCSSLDMVFPKPEVKGFAQSALQAFERWDHQTEYIIPVSTDFISGDNPTENVIGKPLCEVKLLSDLYGYCQVEQPHLNGIPCYDIEKDMIANYMTNGFFVDAGGV